MRRLRPARGWRQEVRRTHLPRQPQRPTEHSNQLRTDEKMTAMKSAGCLHRGGVAGRFSGAQRVEELAEHHQPGRPHTEPRIGTQVAVQAGVKEL